MAISSELEKLERRWQENPTGLTFAPLAEAYRKAGNQERALEVLATGLAVHADYVPALIVRGRCYLDAANLAEAETAFHHVLARDPANPIALRTLADLYERAGRIEEAIERLSLLVEVDRGDGEARASLERLRNQTAAEPAVHALADEVALLAGALSQPGPVPVIEQVPAPELIQESAVSAEAVAVEERAAGEPLPVAAEAADVLQIENLSVDLMAEAEPPPEAEPLPTPAPEPEEFFAPILWTPAPAQLAVAEAEPAKPVVVEAPTLELVVTEELVTALVEPEPQEEVVPAPLVVDPMAHMPPPESPEAADLPWPAIEESLETNAFTREEGAAAPVAEDSLVPEEPTLIVTESMAELFLKQGHRELALAVYRQLAERTPGDERLAEAILRLEAELAPPAPAGVSVPEPPRYGASQTGGRSVESFLQAVLHSPPPAVASTVLPPAIEPAVSSEQARQADQSLALGVVFGEDTPAISQSMEAEPASSSSPSEPSYDEFFGAVPAAEPSAASARPAEVEDLREFNDWLKGLKR